MGVFAFAITRITFHNKSVVFLILFCYIRTIETIINTGEITMMQLGTETGSLVNHVMSHQVANIPEVGEAATLLSYSDRSPGTVTKVFKSGKSTFIIVQDDLYTRTDNNGMSECQDYEYTRNPEGCTTAFRLNGDKWERVYKSPETGRWRKVGNGGLVLGTRERFYDFTH